MILPESEKRTLIKAAEVLGNCGLVVNSRLARYETEGCTGLAARTDRRFYRGGGQKAAEFSQNSDCKISRKPGLGNVTRTL